MWLIAVAGMFKNNFAVKINKIVKWQLAGLW